MSIARHNGNVFARYHDRGKNDPVIENYRDPYSFLVKYPDEFRIEDAVAVHVFSLKVLAHIKRLERAEKRIYTYGEIEEYIFKNYGTHELTEVLEKAEDQLISNDNLAVAEALRKIGKARRFVTTLSGAWQGALGNALFLLIGYVFLLAAYFIHNNRQGQGLIDYWEKCISPVLQ